ncbi:MAG: sigma factor-like helix-turn-helix DNA-binding protein [Oscillospiraceae bacterium]
MEKLQERDRMIFLSRALEERSFAELADEFHIGYKGVAAIYYRTIQRIKKELEERK